jgi:IS5 family transposase
MRFLDLGLGDSVPDATTIWTFRETLTRAGAVERLFALFHRQLRTQGYLAMSGQLVDATIVAAPKQRNTKAEKQAIREGRVPEDWHDQPAKLRQKDRDARWTVKTTKARPGEGETRMVDLAIPEFRRRACRGATGAGPHQHGIRRVGRYRPPVEAQRGFPAPAHAGRPHPPEEAGQVTDAAAHGSTAGTDIPRTRGT